MLQKFSCNDSSKLLHPCGSFHFCYIALPMHVNVKSIDKSKESLFLHQPRFQPENLEHNKKLFERVNEIAVKKGCTPSQLALAWVHHQGNDVCPIPGTTKIENLNQNIKALSVKLSPEEMAELESIASADAVRGHRYGGVTPTYEDSETPPVSSWKPS
ncbi:hypothetical protein CISIN_1g041500mg [Citrus sinensis]|uniref:NADP-dependent oxidoreductase domain-containing protein n=1 Tax=Citrus sinensis TaxID=2711 RepID=A0A067DTK4_CITSI|nr:hypothetical protein CISIN_1g041500mg [Citrus sinensis]